MEIPTVGVWLLTAATAIDDKVDRDGLPATEQINEWLYGLHNDLMDETEPVVGLKLTIHANATFTEEKIDYLNLPGTIVSVFWMELWPHLAASLNRKVA